MTYDAAIFPQHAKLLADSAIVPEVARDRGYVSVDTVVLGYVCLPARPAERRPAA
jgi:hypothetical protein